MSSFAAGRRPTRSTTPTTTRSGAGRCATSAASTSACASRASSRGSRWLTILRKREGFRAAFEGFDPERVAALRRARRRAAAGGRVDRPPPRQDRGGDRERARDRRAARLDAAARALLVATRPQQHACRGRTADWQASTPESTAPREGAAQGRVSASSARRRSTRPCRRAASSTTTSRIAGSGAANESSVLTHC